MKRRVSESAQHNRVRWLLLADQARHMTGGSDDVMEVMERNIPLDGSACSGSRTCKRSSSNMHRYGVLCGEEVVRSRVGAAPRCVLMEADVDTGLFWCAVSHVFEFAPTTRGRREFEAGVCPVRDPLEHQSASYGESYLWPRPNSRVRDAGCGEERAVQVQSR